MIDDLRSHTLPIELGYKILEEAWSLPLSRAERHDLLPRPPITYAAHLLSLLQPAAHDYDLATNSVHAACNSITFHIYDPSPVSSSSGAFHLYGSSNPTTRAMETVLRAINTNRDALAPALHRVALHYTGWSFTRELEHARLSYLRRCALPMPGVQTLGIYGACPAFVVDVARACPALQEAGDGRHDEHLGRKSAPDEKASIVDAFARAPEDMRKKSDLPYGFLLKRKPARI
ncbi:hypothetical protein EDB83DRAFT_2653752 [Lactarius deliciosus]|nr:hypothetical protein EDB83DRAFT_2653752 [Lactarius deliciosus]